MLAPFLLWWQWNAAVDDVRTASGDPTVHAAYYAPLLAALEREGATGGAQGRLEIPFTRLHWESRWVAPAIPLARGWERQLDVERNAVFYAHRGHDGAPLTAARYRAWLRENAIRWVALPDSRLDYSAKAEARLIARGLPYLRPVWRGAHWRLYEVAGAAPLATPPARVLSADVDGLTLAAPGPATVRLASAGRPTGRSRKATPASHPTATARSCGCVAPARSASRRGLRSAGSAQTAHDAQIAVS